MGKIGRSPREGKGYSKRSIVYPMVRNSPRPGRQNKETPLPLLRRTRSKEKRHRSSEGEVKYT
ncbi:UNVERIFIED_CONTAM: hypothetical protein Sangu_2900500 [Sesamum angustifolium]|uniref:Ribosomal protein S4 n=1 Tax=Sesamum angustifolium TaxID=2727405 RepID=A0AAW2ILS6_9LAMI